MSAHTPSHPLTDPILSELHSSLLSLSTETLSSLLSSLFTSRARMYAKDKRVMCEMMARGVVQASVCMVIGEVGGAKRERLAESLGVEEGRRDDMKEMKGEWREEKKDVFLSFVLEEKLSTLNFSFSFSLLLY